VAERDEYSDAADEVARSHGFTVVADNSKPVPLILRPARLPDPTTIPPRRWLLGTQLLRSFVTVLVAPGGTGKSIYAMTAALSLATGQKLIGLHVWERVNVAVINEDPLDELERRLAALLIRHRVSNEEVSSRYFLNSMDDRVVRMAARGPDGFTVVHPDEDALVEQIKANSIGLLVIDPFAESHTLEENSNPDMIKAAAAWRRVARLTGAAIMLVHHVRKGAGEGGIDAARGAKGLTDSARVGLLMQAMTEDEADKLNLPKKDRHQFIRVDDGKVNLSPRLDEARWYQLSQVDLKNATEQYPHGDKVAALVPWEPPKLFSTTTPDQINEVLDIIDRGPESGVLYGGTSRGGSARWAGNPIKQVCDVSDKQAQAMLDAWVASGLLYLHEFKHPATRKLVPGLKVDNSKRPT
jgi:hypothetical protein